MEFTSCDELDDSASGFISGQRVCEFDPTTTTMATTTTTTMPAPDQYSKYRGFKSVVFNSTQKMALRALYVVMCHILSECPELCTFMNSVYEVKLISTIFCPLLSCFCSGSKLGML